MLELKLNPNKFGHLTNDKFAAKCTVIKDELTTYTVITTTLKTLVDAFTEKVVLLKDAIVATRGNSHTQQLEKADKFRDELHSALIHLLRALQKAADPAIRDAAEKVFFVVKQFGLSDLRNSSDEGETSKIESLIAALGSADLATDLAKLPLITSWVADLTTANNSFKALFDEKLSEADGRLDYIAGDIRREIMPIYNNLVNTCLGLANAEVDPEYVSFIHKLNTIIGDK